MWRPDTHGPWCQALELARSQAIRSIVRGMGPAVPKLDLRLESAPDEFEEGLRDTIMPFPGPTALAGSWFLLRSIEISNVQCRDVTFNRESCEVTLQLPVSRVDPEAKGCSLSRTHCCSLPTSSFVNLRSFDVASPHVYPVAELLVSRRP